MELWVLTAIDTIWKLKSKGLSALLLAATGGEPPGAATLWSHGAADRIAAFACRVDEPANGRTSAEAAEGEGKVSEESVRRRSASALEKLREAIPRCSAGRSLFDSTSGCIWVGRVVGCWSGRRSITEIPVTIFNVGQARTSGPSSISVWQAQRSQINPDRRRDDKNEI